MAEKPVPNWRGWRIVRSGNRIRRLKVCRVCGRDFPATEGKSQTKRKTCFNCRPSEQ